MKPPKIKDHTRLFGLMALLLLAFGSSIPMKVSAQKNSQVYGTVREADGNTIPGVNVIIKGTTEGTVTDIKGAYSITTSGGAVTLVFSFVGFQSQEVQAKPGSRTDVVMKPTSVSLSDVVVVGYGTQRKSVLSGAISSVKNKDFENQSITTADQTLQGRTSGVMVTSNSGSPGAGSTILVRGITSINNSTPLYVVDGMQVDEGGLGYLNPLDIQSIEVLKDAAAQAIYGTKAASGVVLITTKKGEANKLHVNYHAYIGSQAPAHKIKLLDATEYATLQNESMVNAGKTARYADPASYGAGTDWQEAIFNRHAGIQMHDLSFSGGNDKALFFTSLGYFNQQGVILSDISNYKRLNLRMNAEFKPKTWLKCGTNIGYAYIKSQGSLNTNSEYGGPLASAINLDPITPMVETNPDSMLVAPYNQAHIVRDANGNPYGISTHVQQEMSNPLAYAQTKLGNYGWSHNLIGNTYMAVSPIKNLEIKTDVGTKTSFYGSNSFTPIYWLNAVSNSPKTHYFREMNKGISWSWENTATYQKKIGKNNFNFLVGTGAYVLNTIENISVIYDSIPVNTFEQASMNYSGWSADNITAWGWESYPQKLASAFARIFYDFDEKYLFSASLRRDGSSKFGRNHKFGYFPAFSAGWVISREQFWPQNKVVNLLKVRGSFGKTGNDLQNDFAYVSTVSSGRNYTFGDDNLTLGYSPDAPENPDLHWEAATSINFGFEATLFENITLVFDVYSKKTTDMLNKLPIPDFMGTKDWPWANVSSMVNKGVEIEAGYHKIFGKLDLEAKANATYLQNRILSLVPGMDYIPDRGSAFQSSQFLLTRFEEGHSYNEFYGFQVDGIFQNKAEVNHHKNSQGKIIQPNAVPGDLIFADLNDDGQITADDRTFIGNPTPDWTFGATVNLKYLHFDMSLFMQGVAGNQIFNAMRRLDIKEANWTADALDRWTTDNPSSTYPRLNADDPNHNFSYPSSFYLSDGAYLRVKSFQIGYTLPNKFTDKYGMNNLRFYVSSGNLLTITRYNGFDPEIGGSSFGIDRGIYPQARSFTLGVNLGL